MPDGETPGIVGLLDDFANVFKYLKIFSVLVKIIPDISLFEHGIDTAQAISSGVRHLFEPLARPVKIHQCFPVGPPTQRFLGG
jgi:hypothetical protein